MSDHTAAHHAGVLNAALLDDSEELKRNKKYVRFQSDFQKCLSTLERTPLSDWASLTNGLIQIQKTLDGSSFAELHVIPERMLLCRVLARCLDPNVAMGVHRKAIETLGKVCVKLGPEGVAACLPLLFVGALHLFPLSAMQTRPDIMTLLELHVVTLPPSALVTILPGVLGAILPCLEDSDASDMHRRAMAWLQRALRQLEACGQETTFFHCVWSAVRNVASCRVGALTLLKSLLKKAVPLPSVDEQRAKAMQDFTCPSQLTDTVLGGDTSLVLTALQVALQDRSERCLRGVLDLLVFQFPLHEEGTWSFRDLVGLMTSCLRIVVTNPQNAVLRRVFMWIYGGNEYNTTYYQVVSARYIQQAVVDLFTAVPDAIRSATQHHPPAAAAPGLGVAKAAASHQHAAGVAPLSSLALPFDVLQALLGRPEGEEHFFELMPDVTPSLCGALEAAFRSPFWIALSTRVNELLAVMPWSYLLGYVKESIADVMMAVEVNAGQSGNESIPCDVLRRILAILDATRTHYVSAVHAAPSDHVSNRNEDADRVAAICSDMCRLIVQVTRLEGIPGGVDTSYRSQIIRLALEVFQVTYYGILKGLTVGVGAAVGPTVHSSSSGGGVQDGLADTLGAPSAISVDRSPSQDVSKGGNSDGSDEDDTVTGGETRGDRCDTDRFMEDSEETSGPSGLTMASGAVEASSLSSRSPSKSATAAVGSAPSSVFVEFTGAFVAVCQSHSGGSSALSVTDLFGSTACVRTTDEQEDVQLFSDLADTFVTLLSHARQDHTLPSGGGGDRGRPHDGVEVEAVLPDSDWVRACESVVVSCGTDIAFRGAAVLLESYMSQLLTAQQMAYIDSSSLLSKLLQFLWSLFTVSASEHHVELTRLFVRLSSQPGLAGKLEAMLSGVHPANCRQFYTLCRLLLDQYAVGSFHGHGRHSASHAGEDDEECSALFGFGVTTMMTALNHSDPSVRLIASSFLEQSLHQFQRVTHPILRQLNAAISSTNPGAAPEGIEAFLNVGRTLMQTAVGRSGPSVVQRLWSLPLPKVAASLMNYFERLVMNDGNSGLNAASFGTPPPSTSASTSASATRSSGVFSESSDHDMIVNNVFSLCLFIAVRVLRRELRRCELMTEGLPALASNPSSSVLYGATSRDVWAADEAHLASASGPSGITQGHESRLCVLALDFLLIALRNSVSFSDPPETVANACAHLARVSMQLLPWCIVSRLPTAQVQLQELYVTAVTFLDHSGRVITSTSGRRMRTLSELSGGNGNGDAADGTDSRGESGAITSSSKGTPSSKSKRSASQTTAQPADGGGGAALALAVLSRDMLRTLRHGLIAAAVAELHPTLSCYGLFNHWRSFVVALLPLFHDILHDAIYEVTAAHTTIIRCVRDRSAPFTTAASSVVRRSLLGLGDLIAFIFKPSTKLAESTSADAAATSGGNRKLESMAQLPMWLLQQGLNATVSSNSGAAASGGASGADGALSGLSNYDLAMKELLVCLDILIPVIFDTYLKVRRLAIDATRQRHREGAASMQASRQLVEAPIKMLLDCLVKDVETEFFEKVLFLWCKRNSAALQQSAASAVASLEDASCGNGSPLVCTVADGSDETYIVELLGSSAGVTPASVIVACDVQLTRYRKGQLKAAVSSSRPPGAASSVGELPFDAAVLHFLMHYFARCKGPDRFDKCITPLVDMLLGHLNSWSGSSSNAAVSLVALPMMLRLLTVVSRRYAQAVSATTVPVTVTATAAHSQQMGNASQQAAATAAGLSPFFGTELASREKRILTLTVKVLETFAAFPSALVEVDETFPFALRMLADVMPEFVVLNISRDQSDKLAEAFGTLYSKVLGPQIASTMNHKGGYERILQLASKVNSALSLLKAFLGISDSLVPRKIKQDLIDVLFSQSFFKMSRQSVSRWRSIFEKLTQDKTINAAILARFNATATPQSVLTAIVQSQDDEASARGRYLKRLAFYVFSAAQLDREFVSGVREKLVETFRQFGRHSKLLPVRYALLVFRVLMTRISPQMLQPFWTSIIPELIRWLSIRPTGDDDFYLSMEALKVIDFAITVTPSEFQVFRWVFLDDCKSTVSGNVAASATSRVFTPLVCCLAPEQRHAGGAPRRFDLSSVRREAYASAPAVAPSPLCCALHRPLLAIPERCYFDVRGVEVICSALQLASNVCTGDVIADTTTAYGGATLAAESDIYGLVRSGDGFDAPYVDWLLEAEFLHVGVAASETKHLQRQASAMSSKLAFLQSNPVGDLLSATTAAGAASVSPFLTTTSPPTLSPREGAASPLSAGTSPQHPSSSRPAAPAGSTVTSMPADLLVTADDDGGFEDIVP